MVARIYHNIMFLLFFPLWRAMFRAYQPERRREIAAIAELVDGEAAFDAARETPTTVSEFYFRAVGLPWRR